MLRGAQGVDKIGDKTATALLKTFGSVDGVLVSRGRTKKRRSLAFPGVGTLVIEQRVTLPPPLAALRRLLLPIQRRWLAQARACGWRLSQGPPSAQRKRRASAPSLLLPVAPSCRLTVRFIYPIYINITYVHRWRSPRGSPGHSQSSASDSASPSSAAAST